MRNPATSGGGAAEGTLVVRHHTAAARSLVPLMK